MDQAEQAVPIGVGDAVRVAVHGRVIGLHTERRIPGAYITAGGNDFWVPLDELVQRDGAWYVAQSA